MNKASDSSHDKSSQPDPVRTEEPKAPYGADEPNPSVVSDDTVEDQGNPQDAVEPGKGGYVGRDPKTEMPAVPSVPETQGEAPTHEGQPDDKERWAAE